MLVDIIWLTDSQHPSCEQFVDFLNWTRGQTVRPVHTVEFLHSQIFISSVTAQRQTKPTTNRRHLTAKRNRWLASAVPLGGFLPDTHTHTLARTQRASKLVAHVSALALRLVACDGRKEEEQEEVEEEEGSKGGKPDFYSLASPCPPELLRHRES
ncbi:hypothetical protein PAMP_014574 [Pampus punctatissimus]